MCSSCPPPDDTPVGALSRHPWLVALLLGGALATLVSLCAFLPDHVPCTHATEMTSGTP